MADLLLHTKRTLEWIIQRDDRVTRVRLEKIRSWVSVLCSFTKQLAEPFDLVFDTILTAQYSMWNAEPFDAATLLEAAKLIIHAQEIIDCMTIEDCLFWRQTIIAPPRSATNADAVVSLSPHWESTLGMSVPAH